MSEQDEWKKAHRELAEQLGATSRGRDHCDGLLVIAALKIAFGVDLIAVLHDASEVHITTKDGTVHRIATKENT